MGLLNFLFSNKKRNVDSDQNRYNASIERITNGEWLEGADWEDFQNLGLLKIREEQAKSSNPKFHRTSEELELRFQFSRDFHDQIKFYENGIYSQDDVDPIEETELQIKTYYDFKDFCYSKGPAGALYFQDMWECCHNSKNECFEFVETLENRLSYLKMMERLPSAIIEVLAHKGEILQKDIYPFLSDFPKSAVQKVIRQMDGKEIERIKKGSTYLLSIKEGVSK